MKKLAMYVAMIIAGILTGSILVAVLNSAVNVIQPKYLAGQCFATENEPAEAWEVKHYSHITKVVRVGNQAYQAKFWMDGLETWTGTATVPFSWTIDKVLIPCPESK